MNASKYLLQDVNFSERSAISLSGTKRSRRLLYTGDSVSNRCISSIFSVILRFWCKDNNIYGLRSSSALKMEAVRLSENVICTILYGVMSQKICIL
jgi:hypothetical protein